jgi:hypothetical protein
MSAQPQAIRVRISPGVRWWQAAIAVAAIVLSLLLGLVIGRTTAPAAAEATVGSRNDAVAACTSHVPKRGCRDSVDSRYVGDVPGGTVRVRHG